MDTVDFKPVLGGGRASSSGAFYHLSFRSGSRASGAGALSAHDYVARDGEFNEPTRDPALYTDSSHMPFWAEPDSSTYWDAADLYERENGRLYVSADFAIPRELNTDDQIQLARDFARALTDDEKLPYTLAVHAGRDPDGRAHNPHAHLWASTDPKK